MKWQRARILRSTTSKVVGRVVWVKCGPPTGAWGTDLGSGAARVQPAYDTNLVHDGIIIALAPAQAELLNGPDNFADDVPIRQWDEFRVSDDL